MKKLLILIVIIIVVAGSYYLISPLFINNVVDEDLNGVFDETQMPAQSEIDQMTEEEKKQMEMSMTEKMQDEEVMVEEVMKSDPIVVVKEGNFVDTDSIHKGSGQAKIYVQSNQNILRLENFEVTNGPDLYVVLSENADPLSRGLGSYLNLGRLKGNIGNQNYEIGDVDISKYKSAVIYCKAFSVIFSVATF